MPTDRELWQHSADAWIASMDAGEVNRRYIDPFVWEALGDVQNLRVLDLGCGEGRFGRQLAERGARVTGLEPTAALCAAAQARGGYDEVLDGDATQLTFPDAHFDLVLAYLVLIDIADFRAAIREAHRVLRPGGRFIVPNITPFRSATTRYWLRDEGGAKLGWIVEDYGVERAEVYEWSGIRVRNYHRPLTAYLDAYLEAGFVLERYRELLPSDAILEEFPTKYDERMAPNFDLAVLRKPV